MGITVYNNRVTINTQNKNGINISYQDNPRKQKINNFNVFSIFQRTQVKERRLSDGNPVVHALKGSHGYYLECSSRLLLYRYGIMICDNFFQKVQKPCKILVVPSSSQINLTFSQKIGKKYNIPVEMPFNKKTVKQILSNKAPISEINKKYKKDYLNEIKRLEELDQNSSFTMKAVSNNIRKYFCPLDWNKKPQTIVNDSKLILVIDDVYSTGTSINSAMSLIKKHNSHLSVMGLTIFSGLKSKKLVF